jgi:hypothetical protein
MLLAKLNQMPKFVLALRTVDQHRHMRRTRRRLNRYRRAWNSWASVSRST